MPRWRVIFALLFAALAIHAACRRHPPAGAPRPATMPAATDGRSLDSQKYGVHVSWPEGWSQRTSDEFMLALSPADRTSTFSTASDGDQTITLDVPDLPPHLPGMIPINLVANGFIDDLKKQHSALRVIEQKDATIPNATARRVATSWTDSDGAEHRQDALLMVHDDRVYIIRGTGKFDDPRVRDAFEQVVQSLKWIPRQ